MPERLTRDEAPSLLDPHATTPAPPAAAPTAPARSRRQPFDDEMIEHLFSYHPPTPEQTAKYEAIRAGAKAFARILRDNTIPGADQSAMMRLLRQTVTTANASIALDGRAA
jgi:hypothetical protein